MNGQHNKNESRTGWAELNGPLIKEEGSVPCLKGQSGFIFMTSVGDRDKLEVPGPNSYHIFCVFKRRSFLHFLKTYFCCCWFVEVVVSSSSCFLD